MLLQDVDAGRMDEAAMRYQSAQVSSAVSQAGMSPATDPQAGHSRSHQGSLPQGLSLDACFGRVIRTVSTGESFGELALLHKHARRTATVLACPPVLVDSEQPAGEAQPTRGVDLIRVARQDYDDIVSATSAQAC